MTATSDMPVQDCPSEEAMLTTLPAELIQSILELLPPEDIAKFAVTCRWSYDHAIPLLWKDVELVDCWTLHPRPSTTQHRCFHNNFDEHDDTPILKKLLVLAKNPFVASKVQTVLHRCHLPTPNIFTEMPYIACEAPTLSQDPRTWKLLQLAISNMINVHTLRIVFGHYHLTYGLLYGFFHPNRPRDVPLRKLWLESCSLVGPQNATSIPYCPDLSGLESIRVRRLSYLDFYGHVPRWSLARSKDMTIGTVKTLNNGIGGEYRTAVRSARDWKSEEWEFLNPDSDDPRGHDDTIYELLPEVRDFLNSVPLMDRDPPPLTERARPKSFLACLLLKSDSTLTSLNLDWLLTWSGQDDTIPIEVSEILEFLSALRFPHLRAFQLRNAATTKYTKIPEQLYLLDAPANKAEHARNLSFLGFMEAHPKIQCLAWPMCRFFGHHQSNRSAAARSDRVLTNLARTLTELRVDTHFSSHVEERTDGSTHGDALNSRTRRRRFISQFAARMTKVEHLKMEGGIPLDEKRETVRALHRCPLKKVVMIGVSCPIGNTWGSNDDHLGWPLEDQDGWMLEDEDFDALNSTARTVPVPPGPDFHFKPQYGWPASTLMTHTIATFHASSVTELKFCGYNGAPIIFAPTPLTDPILLPLRHFHNLRELVISMWMLTYYDGAYRDDEVISYWIDAREPSNMALAPFHPPPLPHFEDTNSDASFLGDGFLDGADFANLGVLQAITGAPAPPPMALPTLLSVVGDPLNGSQPLVAVPPLTWAQRLETQYAPDRLAAQVVRQIGPYLSEQAKARPGGVRVRASFCLGGSTGDIFDLDVRVGKEGGEAAESMQGAERGEGSAGQAVGAPDALLSFTGPREENERERWWGKLNARRWF